MEGNINNLKFAGLALVALFASLLINYNGVLDTYYDLTGKVIKETVSVSPSDKIKIPPEEQCRDKIPRGCEFFRFERADRKRFMVTQYGSYICYYGCPDQYEASQNKNADFEPLPTDN